MPWFFWGILPEQNKRELVAKNLGISAKNDFSILERIGGECAGAVTFMPSGEALPRRDYRYRDLSNTELVDMLKTLPRHPLLAGDEMNQPDALKVAAIIRKRSEHAISAFTASS